MRVEFPAAESLSAPPASWALALDLVVIYREALERELGLRVWCGDADVDLRVVEDAPRCTIAIASKTTRGLRRLHGPGLLPG